MKWIPVLLVALSAGANSSAAEWKIVSLNKSAIHYYDASSVAPVDGYWRTWKKVVYTDPKAVENVYPVQKEATAKYLQYFDCNAKRQTISQWISYDDQGNVITSRSRKFSPANFEEVVPETIGEETVEVICTVIREKTGRGKSSK